MSLNNKKTVQDFILEMIKKTDEQQRNSKRILPGIFADSPFHDRRPPREFKDSSFLYARSYFADIGLRPFGGIMYWESPDLEISPVNNDFALTTNLIAGQTYKLRCTVRNRGDLNVPSAKVEFWLVTPSLGFSTRYAKKVGVVGAWVNPYSSAEVALSYTVPASDVGHKCLFARIFSFSPLDIPLDDYGLNPTIDRHIAQKNLNIIAQGSNYSFNLIHAPNANVVLKISALKWADLQKTGMNMHHDLNPVKLDRVLKNVVFRPTNRDIESSTRGNNTTFYFNGHSEFSRQMQKKIFDEMREFLRMNQKEEINENQFRETLHQFRQLSKDRDMTNFHLDTSRLAVPHNSFGGFHLTATDQNTNEEIGGITIIVTHNER